MSGQGAADEEKLLEAGRRCLADGDAGAAISSFNAVLKISPSSAAARLGLYRAFMARGDAGETQFYVLAMEAARRSGSGGTLDPEAADRLITAGFKAGRLDELAREFKARAEKDPDAGPLLKKIYTLSLLAADRPARAAGYSPGPLVRGFFDYLLLPVSCAVMIVSLAIPRARPAFGLGVFLFASYAVYRAALLLLRRYR
ncbi:MAG TPA: hypothetical protein PK523_03580 [Elusimicrobiales bacterium]|nr:hypothetical protein [Elusimicrobiales bacterium]